MKKFYLIFTVILIFILSASFGQKVDRQMVLLEKFSGIGCNTCPAAANGSHDLEKSGASVAIISYQWAVFDKIFTNQFAQDRVIFYSESFFKNSIPLAIFDGKQSSHAGGSSLSSAYKDYLPIYEKMIEVKSPLFIEIKRNEIIPDEKWNITVKVIKKDISYQSEGDLVLRNVLTESNINYSWQGMTSLSNIERSMYPSQSGVKVEFNEQNEFTYSFDVVIKEGWNFYNCDIIAFVQDDTSVEIQQAFKIHLSDKTLESPENLVLTKDPCSKNVDLKWDKVIPVQGLSVKGYNVYNEKAQKLNNELITDQSFTVKNAYWGRNCFSVATVYNIGESKRSDNECIDIENPPGPSNLEFVKNLNEIYFFWNVPDGVQIGGICAKDFKGYNIYRDGKKINTEPLLENIFTDILSQTGSYIYYVTAQYTEGESYRSNTLFIDVTTVGITKIDDMALEIYPNPVNGNTLHVNGDYERLVIHDISGKILITQLNAAGKIDISNLNNGIYFVKVFTLNGDKIFKLIKTN